MVKLYCPLLNKLIGFLLFIPSNTTRHNHHSTMQAAPMLTSARRPHKTHGGDYGFKVLNGIWRKTDPSLNFCHNLDCKIVLAFWVPFSPSHRIELLKVEDIWLNIIWSQKFFPQHRSYGVNQQHNSDFA